MSQHQSAQSASTDRLKRKRPAVEGQPGILHHGAAIYNVAHSLIGPMLLAAFGVLMQDTLLIAIATIWIAHIGFDRALGYGLKYSQGFTFTHLGRIGRAARQR